LIAQSQYGPCTRRLYRGSANGDPCYAQCEQTAANKHRQSQVYPVREIFEPTADRNIGNRPSDEIGNEYKLTYLASEQKHNIPDASAHHLAYTDFLRSIFCLITGQSIQP